MGDKGSANSSGMMEAMASAQASQQAYQLGEQQLQWTQQVWNQEQPLMDASEQQQMSLAAEEQSSLEQSDAESAQQYAQYESTYAPLEAGYVQQAENWASPSAVAEARGQAMSDVAEQGQAGLNSAAETLRGYGINPGSGRYAALYTGAQPMLGAAEAAAGTTTAQNLREQQMGLEAGAINTGRGLVNATQGLTSAGTGAGNAASGSAGAAANTANTNLSTGSTAMTNPAQWFNAGSNAMNTYVGAVNGYNTSQAQFAQAGAEEMGGIGSALGTFAGLGMGGYFKSDSRSKTDIKHEGTASSGIPIYSYRYEEDPKTYPKVMGPMAEDVAMLAPEAVGALPGPGTRAIDIATLRKAVGYAYGGMVDPTLTPTQGGGYTGIPSAPVMPIGATTGGTVPVHASPSMGAATDDVPAMLTANEFVIPKDVATWVGHKALAGQIDKARQEQQQFAGRNDIGGEPTHAIPQHPTFVSRPVHGRAMGGAIPFNPRG
jgi:hypothetical protein